MIVSTKEAHGFCSDQFPDKSGYTWTLTTLLGRFLRDAEDFYGPRDHSWTPLGIEFSGDMPQLWYPGNVRNISIMLSDSARLNPQSAIFQLAHEVIHLLAPTGGAHAPCIEEGLATLYSHMISAAWGLGLVGDIASYLTAERHVHKLLSIRPDAIKAIRMVEPSFVKFSPELIRSVIPECDTEMAKQLCQPFVRGV